MKQNLSIYGYVITGKKFRNDDLSTNIFYTNAITKNIYA